MSAAHGGNRLLGVLPAEVRARVQSRAERVPLALKQVAVPAHEPIQSVWFPQAGVVSLVIDMQVGGAIEVATVGREGFVGSPLVLGADRSHLRAFVQVPGEALRMSAGDFLQAVKEEPALHTLTLRHTQALLSQVAQSTACNHLHSVQERMCRWLLMTHDRVGTDEFPLTQEFLAQMLGVRRPSVTVTAGVLQQAGLIRYQRGRMAITDRAGLEEAACECYAVVRREYERLLPS